MIGISELVRPPPPRHTRRLTHESGAGFYLNATDPKYRKHYNMYDLIVKELPAVLKEADLGLVSFSMIFDYVSADTVGHISNVAHGTLHGR